MFCPNNKVPNVRHIILQTEDSWVREELTADTPFTVECVDEIVPLENVTVKFRITDTQVIAQIYPNRMSMGDIKKDISRKFEINPEWLRLVQCNQECGDDCLLMETGNNEFGIHEFELLLNVSAEAWQKAGKGKEEPKLDLNVYYDKHRLPDFITVHIPSEDTDDGKAKNIVVEIQNKAIVKPFLCGYRDKNTGVEYFDAFSQTGPLFDKWKYRRYISRDTQTHEHKEKLINTMHDQASQCFLDGNNILHVVSALDFTITPRKYQTAAQKLRLENKIGKIRLIQRNWRRYLIVRYMKNAAAEYRRLVANRTAMEDAIKKEYEERIAHEKRAKIFPRTKADFDILYAEVEKWKKAELKRICEMYDGAPRIAEINILLDKEVQLLNGINRQKNLVSKALEDYRNEKLLTKLGTPIKWIGYKDKVVHLDLLRTQRARFLGEIYKDLKVPLGKEERLELIRKVTEILIKEQDFPQLPELWDMFEREKNLLLYTKYCDVDVLRKRQNILFEDLIKYDKEAPRKKTAQLLCNVCKKVKPYEEFAVQTRQDKVEQCKQCFYMPLGYKDNFRYVTILKAVQRDERRRCIGSLAFCMQVDDMRYLINKIWHGHSILSKKDDLSKLRMARWIKSEDWSPWNCILLTEEEARNHVEFNEALESIYDEKLIVEVKNRHLLARTAFHSLAAVGTEFLETGEWWKAGLNKQRTVEMKSLFDGNIASAWLPLKPWDKTKFIQQRQAKHVK